MRALFGANGARSVRVFGRSSLAGVTTIFLWAGAANDLPANPTAIPVPIRVLIASRRVVMSKSLMQCGGTRKLPYSCISNQIFAISNLIRMQGSDAVDKARSKPARDVRTEPRTPLDFATVGPFQLGPLDTIILYLWLAERAVERRFHLDMGSHSSRVAALTLISANPGTNQKVLGEALGRDKSTLSVALRDLEREGLLTRTRSASDARASAIWLTAEGTAKFKALQSGMRRLDAELERIVGNDRDILLETLKKIAIGLSGDERS